MTEFDATATPADVPTGGLRLHRLDEGDQRWTFPPGSTVRIGRGAENDVTLEHRGVSRAHAVVHDDGDRWICSCIGRNGSYLHGEAVDEFEVETGVIVQFAPDGPVLHFQLAGVDVSDDEASVTNWLKRLGTGDDAALGVLWERYFPRVVNLARTRLHARYRRVADEEDVALSVFQSLVDGVEAGRFPDLSSRENLWRILAVITSRKAVDRVNHEQRQKRGGGEVRGDSIFVDDTAEAGGFGRFAGEDPTPDLALELAERADEMLDALETDEHRRIAELKLEGYDNDEIAELLEINLRTVQRRLKDIRDAWSSVVVDDLPMEN